ncbi:response regulator transcription factor [Pedobacter cryotolerans]|uniref:Response regulator n=1 Tax=Pedobacter cryotolerans TaxID=2571270 RepID=A0A4U1C8V6_9SPHI|nr:response regulator transcription factor [Pedobacter cryotolerans]TKC01156.1 response regulator [Pedobacter cryotolerans]
MKKNIYVVEDNDDIRELVHYLLESEGYEVEAFANVSDFEQKFELIKPDALVLDIMLPDGNGMDLCNKIKANASTENMPILLMSANTNALYINKKSTANDFISKPFDIDEFVQKVAKILA